MSHASAWVYAHTHTRTHTHTHKPAYINVVIQLIG